MKNYNKIGYSVPEVAQIFGCTPVTIRRYIYDGDLKADVSKNNKKNTIRIRREHLVEYMTEHKGRFSVETLKQFGVTSDSSVSVSKATKQQKSPDFAPGAYAAKDVSELDGAWSTEKKRIENAGENTGNTKVRYSNHGAASVSLSKPRIKSDRYPEYDIVADGKVIISGCEKLTVGKIVDALIMDRNLEITNISITRK